MEFQGNSANVKAFASYYADNASINAAGSGGTDGTYYQDITNANTQQGHGCTVRVVISGGVMSSVTLLYPGWQINSALPSATPVAVGGLTGGVINIGSFTEYPVGNGGKQFATSFNIADFVLNTFSNEAAGDVGWICFPGFPPLNVFFAGNTGSAPVPDLKLGGLTQSWTLNANSTWGAPINPTYLGQQLTLLVTASGAFTTAWNAIYRNAPSWGTAVNAKKATARFVWDGVSWQFVGGSTAFA